MWNCVYHGAEADDDVLVVATDEGCSRRDRPCFAVFGEVEEPALEEEEGEAEVEDPVPEEPFEKGEPVEEGEGKDPVPEEGEEEVEEPILEQPVE